MTAVSPKAVLIIMVGGLLFWLAAVGIGSSQTTRPLPETSRRGNPHAEEAQQAALPADVAALEAAAAAHPDDIAAQQAFAEAAVRFGAEHGDASVLMKAVKAFTEVLRIDPRNAAALRAVAEISFENGVMEKAAQYYERYLAVEPRDLKAGTNYGLTLLQLNQTADAIKALEQVVQRQGDFFPARLSLALAYKIGGEKERARAQADEAMKIAPDDSARTIVSKFVENLDSSAQ